MVGNLINTITIVVIIVDFRKIQRNFFAAVADHHCGFGFWLQSNNLKMY